MENSGDNTPRCIVAVLGRKGGVGKTSLVHSLALRMVQRGLRVGLLDADICCPTAHSQLLPPGTARDIRYGQKEGWIPVSVPLSKEHLAEGGGGGESTSADEEQAGGDSDGPKGSRLKLFSMSMLVPDDHPASYAWLPHRKRSLIEQFMSNVVWGPLDVLVVDTPPSIGEVHTALLDCLRRSKSSASVVLVGEEGSASSAAGTESDIIFCAAQRLRMAGIVEYKVKHETPKPPASGSDAKSEEGGDPDVAAAAARQLGDGSGLLRGISTKYNVPLLAQLPRRGFQIPSGIEADMLDGVIDAIRRDIEEPL